MTEAEHPPRATSTRVSMHGGHSGTFCDHAHDTLDAVVRAAATTGYEVYALTEHAPRYAPEHLYDDERTRGRSVDDLVAIFDAYAAQSREIQLAPPTGVRVVRGFECEVLPTGRYGEVMSELRRRHDFDMIVGSVHHLFEIPLDGPLEDFDAIVERCGSVERTYIAYYEAVTEMIEVLRPEVVGHLDLITKHGHRRGDPHSPAIAQAAFAALDAAARAGAILDLNTAGYRKGLGRPYPAPWLVRAALERGVSFCPGDDAHSVGDVGAGIEDALSYLAAHGATSIAWVEPGAHGIERCSAPLTVTPAAPLTPPAK